MKFACLVYVDGKIIGRQSPEQLRALTDKSVEYDWDLRRRGHSFSLSRSRRRRRQ